MPRLAALIAALALVVAACADDDTDTAGTTTTSEATTTTSTALPGGSLAACESPVGFTVSAPEDWATNEGDVVPACTLFNPEPFDVEPGTDGPVAAISASIDPVPFAVASQPEEGRDEDRALTVVQGRQALRLSYESDGEGLFPEGTPVTVYMVDVQPEGGEPATFFIDTVGVGDFDYETNVVVLDRMFQTLDISGLDVELDPAVIAAYGGATGFTVTAEVMDGEVCLRIPPDGEPVCTEPPAPDQVHTIALGDVDGTIQAGVTGEDVWRVDLVAPDGERHSYLPVPVRGADGVGAYAFPGTVEGFERLVLYDITGEEIRTVEPGGA